MRKRTFAGSTPALCGDARQQLRRVSGDPDSQRWQEEAFEFL